MQKLHERQYFRDLLLDSAIAKRENPQCKYVTA